MSQDWDHIIPAPLTGNLGEDAFDEFLRVFRYNKPNFPVINIACERFMRIGVPALTEDMDAEKAKAFQFRMPCYMTRFHELWDQYNIEYPISNDS